ncbi:CHAT domain-containing protein [Aureispira anguillae]|uniref:CHAT domain-containing protein n=1 Tax=Aureispira anguillae TaxID=2864201 RepID=A0A915YGW5_9BACT|nr:CHAT domain-containing protein [Aureispira anguillae]BDS12929.1 CHAT domain-containing protein [Aureispira anguillae]
MMFLKKHLLLVVYLSFCCTAIIAQDQAIQTLHNRLKSKLITVDSSATIYRQLTRLYAKKHKYNQALNIAKKEANIRRRTQQKQKLAEVYFNIASLYRTTAFYQKALNWGQKSLSIYKSILGSNHSESLSIYRFLAQTHYLLEDYTTAILLAKRAITGYKKIQPRQPKAEINLQILLGSIQIQKATYSAAQQTYEYAQNLYRQFATEVSEELLARIYTNLASLKIQQKAILEALAYYQKVVDIRKKLRHENHFTIQTTYTNIGLCYYQLGEFNKALTYHQKSLAILHQTYGQQHDLIAFSHNHIGATFLQLTQKDAAHYHLNQAIKIYQNLFGSNSTQSIAPLWQLAKLFRQNSAYKQAEQYFKKIIHIHKTHHNHRHPDLAKMYLDMAYLHQAQQQYALAYHYTNLAYQSNQLQQHPLDKILMLKIIELKLKISLHLPPKEQEATFLLLDQIQPILALLQTNLNYITDQQNLIQELRKICEQGLELSYQLYQKHPKLTYLCKAFQLMEYNKAVLLSTQIKQSYWNNKLAHYNVHKQEKQLAQLRFLEQKWKKAEHQQNNDQALKLRQEIFKQYELYQEQMHRTNQQLPYHSPIKLTSLQKQLSAQQMLVNYFYGQHTIYILGIQQEQLYFQKASLAIKKDMDQFSNALLSLEHSKIKLSNSCQQFDLVAAKLYDILLPINPPHEVLIIPDGRLCYLPFECLTTQIKPQAKGYHQLNYALHKHTISYAYSATSYYYQQYKHLNHQNIKILGFAPSYEQQRQLPSLHANLTEVQFLEQQFQGAFYYKHTAKKKTFQAQSSDFGVLHLASHALADNHQLQQPKLFFAKDSPDSLNAILQPHEIAQLQLQADFVVLSACQTAIGYWQKGEGIMSLARDFMYAGVPSILTTLWQINDESSSSIIQDFYQQVDQVPKHMALKLAKQRYLEKASSFSAHPYFWSGYILIGNTNRLDIDRVPSTKIWYLAALLLFFLVIIIYCIKIT